MLKHPELTRRPRIFIGIPAYGAIDPEFYEDGLRFAFHMGRRMPDYDFFFGVLKKKEQFRARNLIVDAATQIDADYLFMLDDDTLIDFHQETGVSQAYGFLTKFLEADKDIIGALYWQKEGDCSPVAMLRTTESGYRFLRPDELTGGLQQVDVVGGGAMLVKMKVFNHITFPYFTPEFEHGTDVQLCRKAAEKGFSVWLDSSTEFGHLRHTKTVVHRKTRHTVQADSIPGEVRKLLAGGEVVEDLLRDAITYTGYKDIDEMTRDSQRFMREHDAFRAAMGPAYTDHDWYRQFPRERVARQVWYNSLIEQKRQIVLYMINAVLGSNASSVLDFGCGVGIPSYELAKRGYEVTACDLEGTGTFEFLQWRAKQHNVPMTFHESRGDVPHLGSAEYDVIIAMDCLEHIKDWRLTLRELHAHLAWGGVLFNNNAVLDDVKHPEHYLLDNGEFMAECLKLGLVPSNELTFVKRPKRTALETPVKVSLTGDA